MGLITSLVILAVSSNLLLSLGMVGALSIVRFRTVVKEPIDLVYLFWAISMGIIVGAGLVILAVTGSIVIGVILFIFGNYKIKTNQYIIVINCGEEDAELAAFDFISKHTNKYTVKAKIVTKEGIELTIEVYLEESSVQFVTSLLNIDGVFNATLVAHSGTF
jgi:uncharacterized membrane protein YhiD involved in acid resistance